MWYDRVMIEREIVNALIAEEKIYRPLFKEMTATSDHWKDPFYADVPCDEFDTYSKAAEFYTGSPLEIGWKTISNKYVVHCAGYICDTSTIETTLETVEK